MFRIFVLSIFRGEKDCSTCFISTAISKMMTNLHVPVRAEPASLIVYGYSRIAKVQNTPGKQKRPFYTHCKKGELLII